MRAGRLRHKVSVQSRSQSLNSYGEPSNSFSQVTDGSVWASIEPLTGGENPTGDSREAVVSHKIVMRYMENVSPTYRIVFGSRVFDVVSVINKDERNIGLELMCRERL
jgi:SPP1 family predicted phage head-tail adaptor